MYTKKFPLLKCVIIEEKYGFMSGRSTTTNLLILQQYIMDAFNLNSQVDVIYTNYSKALDKIDHSILALKLYRGTT